MEIKIIKNWLKRADSDSAACLFSKTRDVTISKFVCSSERRIGQYNPIRLFAV